jgi:hypothetical protein
VPAAANTPRFLPEAAPISYQLIDSAANTDAHSPTSPQVTPQATQATGATAMAVAAQSGYLKRGSRAALRFIFAHSVYVTVPD